jgi:Flp pilus assembly protein TadG
VTAQRHRERGASTVEFAVGLSLMVLLVMAVIQFAVYFHLRAVAGTSARHGVDRGRIVDGSDGDALIAANEFLDQSGSSLTGRQVTASRTGDEFSVTVTGQVPSVMPGLNLTVDVTKSAPIEEFVE